MFSDVNENSSHLIGMTDTSLRFVSKEGASGFPTVLCMINRFLIDKSINEWYNNSGVQEEVSIKLGDDLHWFKQMDMLNNFKEFVLNGALKYSSFFEESTDNSFLKDVSFSFKTKNRKYFLINNKLYSADFMSGINSLEDLNIESKPVSYNEGFDSMDKIAALKEQTKVFNENIISALSIGTVDYILTENNLYSRINSDGATLNTVFSNAGIKSICSDYSSTIVVAGSFGGMKITVDRSGNKTSSVPITYKSKIIESSGEEESQLPITPTTITNKLPANNDCTFCTLYEGHLYIGNSTDYGKFSLSDNLFDESMDTTDSDFLGHSIEFDNIHYSKTKSGMILNNIKVDTTFDPTYVEQNKNIYILYGKKGILFVSIEGNYSLNENLLNAKFPISINNKNYIMTSDKVLYSESEKDKIRLYTFNLDFDKESEADKIDVGSFKISITDILDMENVYNEKLKILNDRNITYAIGVSSVGEKNEFYLFGNDERGKVAQEMRQCMNAFDMKV